MELLKKFSVVSSLIFSMLLIIGCLSSVYFSNAISLYFSLLIPLLLVINIYFLFYWSFRKKLYFIPFVISIGLYFCFFDSFFQLNSHKTPLHNNSFSLLTYNTQGFQNYNQDIYEEDKIVSFIKNVEPDIFCIQEFSAIKYKEFDEYPFWFKTNIMRQDKSVMAVFSKHPIVDKGYINFPNSFNGAMFTDILFMNQVFRIYNVHLQSFKFTMKTNKNEGLLKKANNTTKLQEAQAKLLTNHAESFDGNIIIVGDFNCTQFSKSYSILAENRKDSFIEIGKGLGSTYSLLGYPLRLDHILCDKEFEVISHQNFKLEYSDHEPVMVEFNLY